MASEREPVRDDQEKERRRGPRRTLSMTALSGLGIGGIIGAGFFLGSGIVIRESGPLVVGTYMLGGVILAEVMGAITSLAINVPVRTSYQEYIDRFLGSYLGFFLGWAVVISGILSIGSEAVAMAVYSRTWVPSIALGVFAVTYVLIIVGLNLFGLANFGTIESLMSGVKTVVLVGFMAVAALFMIGWLHHPSTIGVPVLLSRGGLAPHGLLSVLRGMLIVIFSYAGVTTLAMATSHAKDPAADIPRAAIVTTAGVVMLYAGSVLALLLLVPWTLLSPHQSPFVTALDHFGLGLPASVFNGAILVASFSVMAGTFYATEWMLITIALRRDAPRLFRHQGRGRPWAALIATATAVLATLVLAFTLPRTVYTDLTAASSYFSFVNWLLILLAFAVWHQRARRPEHQVSRLVLFPPYGPWVMAAAVAALGAYSATVPAFRLGFLVFAGLSLILTAIWFVFRRREPTVVHH